MPVDVLFACSAAAHLPRVGLAGDGGRGARLPSPIGTPRFAYVTPLLLLLLLTTAKMTMMVLLCISSCFAPFLRCPPLWPPARSAPHSSRTQTSYRAASPCTFCWRCFDFFSSCGC
ncbi:hypothetical protein DQ04_15281010 [Trypanosoma grayi]|uniref:hypothetical protein n=1 Tax=Trypanosoma grayi TaxID=71804 RepID=UPI0004F3F770|nr:hypothetical protein DQ04_15281010 [Trypanosoma grayi]KEG06205.1 hypothetical protein DQ04_15281010 [Trypanosoma grayi]